MLLLILGVAIFLGVHTVTTLRGARRSMMEAIGEGPYKGLYSLASLIGLALIVYGFKSYRDAGYIQVWDPPAGMRHLTILLMWFSIVSLMSGYAPGAIQRRLKHPMLVAVKIWALAHLLANGDLGSLILFGSFLAWAVYDRIAVKRRGEAVSPGGEIAAAHAEPGPKAGAAGGMRNDVITVVAGTAVFVALIFLHPYLIGVPVLSR
ncbi:NnrU family protein [Alsobacter sp. KACC 23698]|uniref:NnrU family protein n=1 Tax=Alsobacter sp. KACC 23698 TaxID=3149229 RepID=A0AAU7JM38_9HYPH